MSTYSIFNTIILNSKKEVENFLNALEKSKRINKNGDIKVKKVFISIPMSGKHESMIEFETEIVKQKFRELFGYDEEFVFLDTYFKYETNEIKSLGLSVECLSDADIAVFAPGWNNSHRCIVENMIATLYEIPVVYIK